MTDQDIGVDERAQCLSAARSDLVRRITSSHATLRLAAGTRIVVARERKSGVRASTARLPSTRKMTSSPSFRPSASRTALGTVTCPFDVSLAAASMASPYLSVRVRIPRSSAGLGATHRAGTKDDHTRDDQF